MRRNTILVGIICLALLVPFPSKAETKKPKLPRIKGSVLLVEDFPAGLALTTETTTSVIASGGDWMIAPSMTSDGQTIASARPVPGDPPTARPKLTVGTYSVATAKWTAYADLAVFGGTIAISPDGSRLACAWSPRAGATSILRFLDLKTGTISTGPESTRDGGEISWSPDSRRIVFQQASKIIVLDTMTGVTRAIADGILPAWSPSGEWIAYFHDSRLQLVRPDGSGSRTLAKRGWLESFDQTPVWSPDSRSILIQTSQQESILPLVDISILEIASRKRITRFRMASPVYAWIAPRERNEPTSP